MLSFFSLCSVFYDQVNFSNFFWKNIVVNTNKTFRETKVRVQSSLWYAPYQEGESDGTEPKAKSKKSTRNEEKEIYEKNCDEYDSRTNSDWNPYR